jgi:hypothetical protein
MINKTWNNVLELINLIIQINQKTLQLHGIYYEFWPIIFSEIIN